MFSVVIPLYNKELSVGNTINSVLNQTFKEFEVIIVNDGSTDNSLEIVQQFKDDRIRIIDKPNGGVSSARNRGIKEAKYEWIAFLDADDLWEDNHLQILNDMIADYCQYKVFCTSYIRSNQNFPSNQEYNTVVIEDYFKEAIKNQFFCTIVTCIHNSVFNDVGVFNMKLNRGEDLELWTRIGRKYTFVQSKVVTAIYRIEAENRSDIINYNIKKSFLSTIDVSKSQGLSEKKYLKVLLTNAFKRFLKNRDLKNSIFILKKILRT